MRKKIAVYHPNLSTFGGGEFVCLSVALALAKDYDVTIFTNYSPGKEKLQNFFCVNLGQINIIERRHAISRLPILNSIKPGMILRGVYKMLEAYDLVIDTGTNGWFDKKLNCKTVCYVHFPLFYKKKKGIKKPLNYYLIKPESAFQYDKIICNSEFTKNYVSKQTRKPLEILYPPVNTKGINPGKKSKRIVTIGRLTYDKKHEIMIQAFKVFFDENKDYTFHIIGSFQENVRLYDHKYLSMLKQKSEGYPIEFHINMPHDQVINFLKNSEIYWHARGFDELDPHEYENFGISTVEAMAAGCIPIVINLGAQTEIVEHKKNGFCWNNPKELVSYTKAAIKNPKLASNLKKNALKKSRLYDAEIFQKGIKKIIKSLL